MTRRQTSERRSKKSQDTNVATISRRTPTRASGLGSPRQLPPQKSALHKAASTVQRQLQSKLTSKTSARLAGASRSPRKSDPDHKAYLELAFRIQQSKSMLDNKEIQSEILRKLRTDKNMLKYIETQCFDVNNDKANLLQYLCFRGKHFQVIDILLINNQVSQFEFLKDLYELIYSKLLLNWVLVFESATPEMNPCHEDVFHFLRIIFVFRLLVVSRHVL